jgi:ferredoxin
MANHRTRTMYLAYEVDVGIYELVKLCQAKGLSTTACCEGDGGPEDEWDETKKAYVSFGSHLGGVIFFALAGPMAWDRKSHKNRHAEHPAGSYRWTWDWQVIHFKLGTKVALPRRDRGRALRALRATGLTIHDLIATRNQAETAEAGSDPRTCMKCGGVISMHVRAHADYCSRRCQLDARRRSSPAPAPMHATPNMPRRWRRPRQPPPPETDMAGVLAACRERGLRPLSWSSVKGDDRWNRLVCIRFHAVLDACLFAVLAGPIMWENRMHRGRDRERPAGTERWNCEWQLDVGGAATVRFPHLDMWRAEERLRSARWTVDEFIKSYGAAATAEEAGADSRRCQVCGGIIPRKVRCNARFCSRRCQSRARSSVRTTSAVSEVVAERTKPEPSLRR